MIRVIIDPFPNDPLPAGFKPVNGNCSTRRAYEICVNTAKLLREQARPFHWGGETYVAPKWKGKIGFSDPRVPSSGQSILVLHVGGQGRRVLKKLAQQELLLTRDLRQLTDALAKGKVALAFGSGRSQAEPSVKAGLLIKPAPAPKEGLPTSNGYGVIDVVKDPPHPNATKVFDNWFLGQEGQDWDGRVMQNVTRRLDVDTRWLKKLDVDAAKDALTLQEYHRVRNHLEDKFTKVRIPGGKFAETIFQ